MKPDIKARRLELGLTLEEVGNIVGVGKSTVRKWETGDIENMKRDKIVKLSKALKVSPSYIMGFEEVEEQPTVAAHFDKSDLTEEEMKEVEQFIEFVKNRRKG
ncbi:helix-turn-helix domain-containing protein [Mammaliicoccus sciuri]|uniref:helix-turn-helix domain-containing protein n=1 Tax=Mammaliicoccus sciuri TaxID=1296 RepID=UPI0020A02970|nr:helix-turn-helix transcriptional regulator [Mammaliicoccus sciuri]MCP1288288.1 helix-turn-helix domain-containing protein [Mammaliicoccus sciuri]